ncbi:hypothetical protein GCM10010218_00940 [Streptomyces mashuensis]|uniref:Uncharacterized protein n=1 Tax=Streptomyces mashuensis TaxID=33904 RepID=A0A919AU46_9ACTN|nr:hypothetical protein [Streptomyces mashuensis]GHF24278.1 hypothetical protein GCM10010218_00940 [Streptomyces mashuensis]
MDDKPETGAKTKVRRLELSIAQVAGSALAAVVAALLAGKLGVYGTVLGAGVVSVVATTGGTVFQHLFRRTGEQIREVTVQAPPRLRRVPVRDAGRAVGRTPDSGAYAGARPGAEGDPHFEGYPHGYSEEYSPATTHGTRMRGWKRPLIGAAAVFLLAMGTVTAVELVSGSSADGDKGGTTVSRLFQPEKRQDPQEDNDRSPGPDHSPGSGQEGGDRGATPGPDASQGGGTGKPSPDPHTSPSSGGGKPSPGPTPAPSSSPDAGKGGTDGKADGSGGTTGQGSGGTTGQSAPPAAGQNVAAGTGTGPTAGTRS